MGFRNDPRNPYRYRISWHSAAAVPLVDEGRAAYVLTLRGASAKQALAPMLVFGFTEVAAIYLQKLHARD
jgi:hypothetical protein